MLVVMDFWKLLNFLTGPDSCLNPTADGAVARAEIGGKEMVVREV